MEAKARVKKLYAAEEKAWRKARMDRYRFQVQCGKFLELTRNIETCFNLSFDEVASLCREDWLMVYRQMITGYLKDHKRFSFEKIAALMNRTDHTTAINWYKNHKRELQSPKYMEKYERFVLWMKADPVSRFMYKAIDENPSLRYSKEYLALVDYQSRTNKPKGAQ